MGTGVAPAPTRRPPLARALAWPLRHVLLPRGLRRAPLPWPPARPPPPAQAPVRPPPPRGRGSQRPMLTAAMRIRERMRGFAYPLSSSPKMRHRMRTLLEQLQWLQVAQFPHAQRATRPAGNSLSSPLTGQYLLLRHENLSRITRTYTCEYNMYTRVSGQNHTC